MGRHHRGQAARGDDRGLVAHLGKDAAHQTVHPVGLPQHDAGLDGLHRGGADGGRRHHQRDVGQLGPTGE